MKINFSTISQSNNINEKLEKGSFRNQLNYGTSHLNSQQNSEMKSYNPMKENKKFSSSILDCYFTQKPQKVKNLPVKRQTTVNVSILYPYDIAKSLSPSNIDEEINSLKGQNDISSSALKFIKKEVEKSFINQQSKTSLFSKRLNSTFDQISFTKSLNQSKFIDDQLDTPSSDLPINTILLQHFAKNSRQQLDSNQLSRPTYNKFQSEQNKQNKQKVYKQNQKQQIIYSTKQKKQCSDLEQLKQRPSLNWTVKSKFTKKIIQNRQNKNIYNSLYNDAKIRLFKRSMQKIQQDNQLKQNSIIQSKHNGKITSTYQIKDNFYQRLQKTSIKRKCNQQNLIKKSEIDLKTGKPLYQPNMNASKKSYEHLFHKSLERQLIVTDENKQILIIQQSQPKACVSKTLRNSEMASTTQLSKKSTKNYEQKQQLSTKLQKSPNITDHRRQNVLNRLLDIFYSCQSHENSSSSQKSEIFNKSFNQMSLLTQQQYNILQPMLNQIQKLQEQSNVSKLVFKQIFSKFYKRLTLYDQLILTEPISQQKKIHKNLIAASVQKDYIFSLAQSRKLEENKKTTQFSFKPSINSLSSSLQKSSQRHIQKLLFI